MKQKVENFDIVTLKKTYRRLKRNTKNFASLIARDPMDNLDYELNLEQNLISLVHEVNSNNYHPRKPYLHLSAKGKGINRPTVVFFIKDALVYRFCIEQIETELLGKTRQKNVRGGIKITSNKLDTGEEYYEKWFQDWKQHQDDVKKSLKRNKYLVATDIASYFENINILVLKDLVRSDVDKKTTILNLLFYFLENSKIRDYYEVNTFNGLPQEDIDCSRLLAYYFLNPHDEAMAEFIKENNSEYYRFVDDMCLTVDEKVIGKKALRYLTESLRRLNLVSSIEKTNIIESEKAHEELFFDENDILTKFKEELIENLKNNKSIVKNIEDIKKYYEKLIKEGKNKRSNWIKILKRFYTLSNYGNSDMFLESIEEHLIEYPKLFSKDKIGRYLFRNQDNPKFEKAINSIISYIYSNENLYPELESNILENILMFDKEKLSNELKEKIRILANDIFFRKNNCNVQSNYSRALSCLLIYKYDSKSVNKIATHYINYNENDPYLKKYLIYVALTVKNSILQKKVLAKARTEQDISIHSLVSIITNLGSYKNNKLVKEFVKEKKIIIFFEEKGKFTIEETYMPIRGEILKDLISLYTI